MTAILLLVASMPFVLTLLDEWSLHRPRQLVLLPSARLLGRRVRGRTSLTPVCATCHCPRAVLYERCPWCTLPPWRAPQSLPWDGAR